MLFHFSFSSMSGQYVDKGDFFIEGFIGTKAIDWKDWNSFSNYYLLSNNNISLYRYDLKSTAMFGLRFSYCMSDNMLLSSTIQVSSERCRFSINNPQQNWVNVQYNSQGSWYMNQFNCMVLPRVDYQLEKSDVKLFKLPFYGAVFLELGASFKNTKLNSRSINTQNNSTSTSYFYDDIVNYSMGAWKNRTYRPVEFYGRLGVSGSYWFTNNLIGINMELAIGRGPALKVGIMFKPDNINVNVPYIDLNIIAKVKDKIAERKKQENFNSKKTDDELAKEAEKKEQKEAEREAKRKEKAEKEKVKFDNQVKKEDREWYEKVNKQEETAKVKAKKIAEKEAKEKAKAEAIAEENAGDDFKILAQLSVDDRPYSFIDEECIELLASKRLLEKRDLTNWVKPSEFFPRIDVKPTYFGAQEDMLFNYKAFLIIKDHIGECDMSFRRLLTLKDVEDDQNNIYLFQGSSPGRIRPTKDSKDIGSLLINFDKDVAVCWTEVHDGVESKTVQLDVEQGTSLNVKYEKIFNGFSILTVPDLSNQMFDINHNFFQLIDNEEYVKEKVLSRFERKIVNGVSRKKLGEEYYLYVQKKIVINEGKNESNVKILNGSSIMFYKFQNELDAILKSVTMQESSNLQIPITASSEFSATITFKQGIFGWEVSKRITSVD